MLGAGALEGPRGMVWGGRREEGSGWGTRVYLWRIHVDIWQNQYNIVNLKNKIKNPQNFLAAAPGMWDLSFLTRGQTCTPCIGSAESQPLDPQGSSFIIFTGHWGATHGPLYSINSVFCDIAAVEAMHLSFSSVTQSCPTLCDPRDCSRPGLPVHHQLLKLAQTLHVHRVGDAIHPSHLLLSPAPPAFHLSLPR